jgi:hypothetical protein
MTGISAERSTPLADSGHSPQAHLYLAAGLVADVQLALKRRFLLRCRKSAVSPLFRMLRGKQKDALRVKLPFVFLGVDIVSHLYCACLLPPNAVSISTISP